MTNTKVLLEKYEPVIGLEIHIQLNTKSKLFCADDASFSLDPNTHISAVSLGMPGTLPLLNKQVLDYAIFLSLAVKGELNTTFHFARKNYFYADLPKGYQITQDKTPVCKGGEISVRTEDGNLHTIRLHHIHIEEDAGKSIHDTDPEFSFIDLNRAGVPLLEMVSEPDMHSGKEASLFLAEVRKLVRYLGICDGNMEEGSLRCDANVSVRLRGAKSLGTRTEIKNLNSISFVRKAIEGEILRQITLLEKGEKIVQQTLSYIPDQDRCFPLRSKEEAHDYRYFPEPDLSPVKIEISYIETLRSLLPPLPQSLYEQFTLKLGLSAYDASILTENRDMAEYFIAATQHTKNFKGLANFIIGPIKNFLNETGNSISEIKTQPEVLSSIVAMIEDAKISFSSASQKLFPHIEKSGNTRVEELAKELSLLQTSDPAILQASIKETMNAFPEKVTEYRKGKKSLIGFFMGELMKRSGGQADPVQCRQLLVQFLSESNESK